MLTRKHSKSMAKIESLNEQNRDLQNTLHKTISALRNRYQFHVAVKVLPFFSGRFRWQNRHILKEEI